MTGSVGRRIVSTAGAVLLLAGAGCSGDEGSPPGTELTLAAVSTDGGVPSAEAMAQSAGTLSGRFATAGLGDSEATVDGDRITLRLDRTDVDPQLVADLLAPGEVQFRKVLVRVPDPGSSGTAGPAPDGWADLSGEERQGLVEAKVGEDAWAEATELRRPLNPGELPRALAPFEELSPAEVAVLPVHFQFHVPQVTCATLERRPAGAMPADQPAVACDEDFKYQLAEATVTGDRVATATAEIEGTGAYVEVSFTEAGQPQWAALTEEAARNPQDECRSTNGGNCQVAILLDGVVITAPAVREPVAGPARISGDFSGDEARLLAARIGHGALPVQFEVESLATESPR